MFSTQHKGRLQRQNGILIWWIKLNWVFCVINLLSSKDGDDIHMGPVLLLPWKQNLDLFGFIPQKQVEKTQTIHL
jgi:hypothetical protein